MIVRLLTALAALLVLAPVEAFAAPKDAVFNKEGFWGIDVDRGACVASMNVEGGAVLLFRAENGAVTFGAFSPKRLPQGKAGLLAADSEVFEMPLSYGEGAKSVFYDGDLGASLLAALRVAKEVRIAADKRLVIGVGLEGTGFAGALDGVIACSKGEAGWWGKGVDFAALEAVAYQEFWELKREDGICTMLGFDPNEAALLLVSKGGQEVAVTVASKRLGRRAAAGVVRIDGAAFDFKPEYDSSTYFSAGRLAGDQLAGLSQAKSIVVSLDGREVLDLRTEGMHLDAALAAFIACAKGEPGPWSEPAS